MFDLSFGEMLLIAVLAIIFIGPDDLPAIMRVMGRYYAKARRASDDLRRAFNAEVAKVEAEERRDEMRRRREEMERRRAGLQAQKAAPAAPADPAALTDPALSVAADASATVGAPTDLASSDAKTAPLADLADLNARLDATPGATLQAAAALAALPPEIPGSVARPPRLSASALRPPAGSPAGPPAGPPAEDRHLGGTILPPDPRLPADAAPRILPDDPERDPDPNPDYSALPGEHHG